ncbi:MAG TPA: hypothetical protein VGO62_17545, partial [Myxococcota bacterium]
MANTTHSRLFVADVDIDAAGYLELVAPLSEALVNALAPAFPSLFDTKQDLHLDCEPGASSNIGMCFGAAGIG